MSNRESQGGRTTPKEQWAEIPFRWAYGGEGSAGRFLIVAEGKGRWRFSARLDWVPEVAGDEEHGDFVEGLWERDVVELFLQTDDADDCYLEVNLAPSGAWWAVQLEGVRQRVHLLPELVRVDAVVMLEDAWEIEATISLPSLDSRLVGNVTAISGVAHRRYASWADLGGKRPDFHRPEAFHPLPVTSA